MVASEVQLDRRVAILRVVEALRMDATHERAMTESLSQITEVPVPDDPATGKPIGTPMRHKTAVRFLAFDPGGKTLLTSGFETTAADRTVRLWTVPAPLPGEGERLGLWAQVLTGMELDSQGTVRALEPEEWQQRRRQLEKLGGVSLMPVK